MRRSAAIAVGLGVAAAIAVAATGRLAIAPRIELHAPSSTHEQGATSSDVPAAVDGPRARRIDVGCAAASGDAPSSALATASVDRPRVARRLRVVEADGGVPIADAFVTLERKERTPRVEWRTDPNGALTFLLDRDASVLVQAPGRCAERRWFAGPSRTSLDDERVVELRPACTMAGRVVDADGAPVADVSVSTLGDFRLEQLEPEHGCEGAFPDARCYLGQTDADGRFGPVVGRAAGSTAFLVERRGSCEFVLPGAPIAGVMGERIDVELRLPPLVRLVVEVAGDGAQREDFDFTLERRFDLFAPRWRWENRDDGVVRFDLEAAGPYRLLLRSYNGATDLGGERDIVLAPGTTTLRWTIPASGVAATAGVAPVDRAVRCGVRGSVACDCPPGETCTFRVLLQRDGDRVAMAAHERERVFHLSMAAPFRGTLVAGGSDHEWGAPRFVELQPGATLDIGRIEVRRRARRDCHIVDRGGRPLAGIRFGVCDRTTELRELVFGTTDREGRFQVPRFDGACSLVTYDVAVGVQRFEPPADPRAEWIVVVDAPRRVTGRLVVPGGLPFDQVDVSWSEAPDPSWDENLGNALWRQWERSCPLDRDGRFVFERATSGDFVVTLSCDLLLGGSRIATRTIPAGGDLDLGTWEIPAPR